MVVEKKRKEQEAVKIGGLPKREALSPSMEQILEKIEKVIEIFSYPVKSQERQAEYTKLFINNFEGIKCSPYAGDYFENAAPSDVIHSLKKLYKSAGVKLSPSYKEREDHILTLLEFLGLLIESCVPDEYIKSFVRNYLFWIPHFVEKLLNETSDSLFIEGAKLLGEIYEHFQSN